MLFRMIVNHRRVDGVWIMVVQYIDPKSGKMEVEVPIEKLKVEEPLACAKYIHEYIVEGSRRSGPLNKWAKEVLGNPSLRRSKLLSEKETGTLVGEQEEEATAPRTPALPPIMAEARCSDRKRGPMKKRFASHLSSISSVSSMSSSSTGSTCY